MNNNDISMPIAKASSAIAAATAAKSPVVEQITATATQSASDPVVTAILALPWSTIAQIGAAMYSCLLITEWFWKKFWRPLLERQGWIKPIRHRIITVEEYEAGNTGPAAL
jgi:hypothetical protein